MNDNPVGHLPLHFVRAFGLTDADLRGTKTSTERATQYVCVVRFDQKERKP